jgi:hypothetical protein
MKSFSGLIVCVVAPHAHADSRAVRYAEEVKAVLVSKKAAVLSPADLPYAVDVAARADISLAMVRASQALVLLPDWGGCKLARAIWAFAGSIGLPIVFADRDKSGGIIFPAENAVLCSAV